LEPGERLVFGGEEAWLGLKLAISDARISRTASGDRTYYANLSSQVDGRRVGLDVALILDGWEEKAPQDEDVKVFYGDICFYPVSEDTKNLVGYFDEKIGTNEAQVTSGGLEKLYVDFVAFADPSEFPGERLHGKMFLGDPEQDVEVQEFLTIDAPNAVAWFGEKSDGDTVGFVSWMRKLI
jgi:hypothetical protein